MEPFVVMTFNVRTSRGLDGRNLWWLRRRATVEAIRRARPDVGGLQEVRPGQLRYLRSRLGELAMVGVGRDDGRRRGEHCPVLWRRERFRLEHWEVRWFSDTPQVPGSRGWGNRSPRIATLATLAEVGSGERLGVAVTHLDANSGTSRQRSAEALVAWLEAEPSLPWIVLGDANAIVTAPAVTSLLGSQRQDALAHLPAAGPGAATSHAFTGLAEGARIDHILVPSSWQVISAEVRRERPFGRLPSDHWPVVAAVHPR